MCQVKSNPNINVFSGIIDRDQNIIPTYSRTKKARRSVSAAASSHSTGLMPNEVKNSTETTWTSHFQINSHKNCDYFLNEDKIKRSDLCDKEMMTSNMDQSSCFSSNSQRSHHNNSNNHRNDSTRVLSNSSQQKENVNLENTPFSKMIVDSIHRNSSTHRHRTAKRNGSTKTSDCFIIVVCLLILSIQQGFARPIDNTARPERPHSPDNNMSLQETLRSPCTAEEDMPQKVDHNQDNIKGILTLVWRQSGIAKSNGWKDVEKFLQITENAGSVRDFHYRWRFMVENWLYPQGKLQKEFLEPVSETEKERFREPARKFNMETPMKKLFIDRLTKLLLDCDERFQLLLIGFHNILDDHNNKRSTMDLEKYNPLQEIFTNAKRDAKLLLCEIRKALHKLGAEITILNPDEVGGAKAPNSNFYDWVIFREYMNQVEHVNEISRITLNEF
ncbi:uncharacterized protein LOC116344414 isoform X2 [Contarinia nasturtii]|uniref:uncharacterized protein LOC116344414 isoform X2 n=1 Tax=Contarinia nasturtii TaxID=265458 RepID=UPI0012D480A2|nr:uncharacterized protein LOC116344414 isoform X2 [Contarinia nasturtii]